MDQKNLQAVYDLGRRREAITRDIEDLSRVYNAAPDIPVDVGAEGSKMAWLVFDQFSLHDHGERSQHSTRITVTTEIMAAVLNALAREFEQAAIKMRQLGVIFEEDAASDPDH